MENGSAGDWHEANRQELLRAMEGVRAALERKRTGEAAAARTSASKDSTPASEPSPGSALHTLCVTFDLTAFERDLLVLCAGVELDSAFAGLCATVAANHHGSPTFSLALAALPRAHWSAITPSSPLRHWKLIEMRPGENLTTSPLRISERVLHYLVGVQYMDELLQGVLESAQLPESLPGSHAELARQVAAVWIPAQGPAAARVVQLCGSMFSGRRAIAAAACAGLGMRPYVLPSMAIPAQARERHALARLLEREAALDALALLVEADDLPAPETTRNVVALVEELQSPTMILSAEALPLRNHSSARFDVLPPEAKERRLLWQSALGERAALFNGQIERVAGQFNLNAGEILAAGNEALGREAGDAEQLGRILWEACRRQSRTRMEGLAQRIDPVAFFDELVLPEAQRQVLGDILRHVRQRQRVYEDWGFAARNSRGLGISALFSGPSGTGKTMAAEVLAQELQLDLYRIDLSSVVSKWIGETEKNLRRVFDAAESGGAILLFDEADALFGKRSEVKDSHDRFANIEVSYLLQRMEAYRGLAILTTNLKNALDPAFLRRIRFVVQFPFPDVQQRKQIWKQIFPPATPTEGLDINRLARLSVSGGNIRNIAMNAAFLAADADEPVRMNHLLRAAHSEYAKLEKALTEGEIKGWV